MALIGALVSLVTVVWFNQMLAGLFLVILLLGYAYFRTTQHQREASPFDDLLEAEAEA